MSERHSPVVSFPLRHSKLLHCVWWLSLLASAGLLLMWWLLGGGMGLGLLVSILLSTVVWVVAAVVSKKALQHLPQGQLLWNGQHWVWERGQQLLALQGSPVVMVDAQRLLVLAWRDGQGRTQRFVLQRHWAPQAWADLRRAVYSAAHPTPDAADTKAL